jgi:iron complex outermembrane recepter protein
VKNTGSNHQIRSVVHAILGGVSAAATAPLLAQTAAAPAPDTKVTAESLQEVVITGIRASMQKSLDIKQNAIGVVDAISAEDIGQFPDATIGAALSRVPGVTVDRGAVNLQTTAGAATSTGNVTGVTVRGFGSQFNEILSDGRRIASGIGQNFDFSALSSDWVKEVQVLKTPDMALSTGALGATLNVKFPNPFDAPGLQLRANVSGNFYENDGGVRPGAAALISDTFADDKFGILVSGDYHESHVSTHHVDVVGWKGTYLPCSSFATDPTSHFGSSGCASVGTGAAGTSAVPTWYPQDMAMYYERALELRKDGRVALQWHPTDAVLITIDDNYSSSEDKQDRFQFSTWFGAFPNATQDANGTISDFQYTGPTDFNSFVDETYITTNTPGLNVRWDINDRWQTELDAAQSTSKLNPNHTLTNLDVDTGYGNGTNNYTGGLATGTSDNTLPYWTAYGPNSNFATNPKSPNFFGNSPFIVGSHVIPMQAQISTDKITQAKIEVTWKNESTKVKLGFQYLDDKFDSSEYDDFSFNGSNNNWQLWSGYGPASGNVGQGVALPANLFTPKTFSNFIPGLKGNDKLPPGVNLYNPYEVLAFLETQPINPGFEQTNGYPVPVYPNPGVAPPINLCPSCVNNVQRTNYAPFLVAEHTFGLGDMPLITNLALRYQKTEVTSEGIFAEPVSASVPVGDKTAYSFNFGPQTLKSVSSSYGYFLPSLDLNLLVRPDLKVRFDASRTSSPPPNLDLKPNTSYGGRVNALVSNSGNPALKPYLSNNFDLGLEWYYMRNSYVSADLFFKHITQFPVNGVTYITVPIKDPNPLSTNYGNDMVFSNTTLVNGESANVDGIEVTWQQMLKYGFGFQINGTYVHTNKPFDPYNIEQNTTQFAIPGIGNSANLIAFYENHGFQARLAVQWQARQFLTFGQEQNSAQFGTEPTFLESTTEVDFSTSYDFNGHVGVFFEALNLTDAEYHTTGRFKNQLLNVVDYGRSYTLQIRAKL